MMAAPAFESPKREILVFYYKYRRRLLLAFALPFVFAVAVSFMPVPRFEATSTLVVRLGSEYVYQPETGATSGGQPSPIPFDQDQIYKAEVAILDSSDLHQQVIQSVGLDRMYPVQPRGYVCTFLSAQLDKWFPDNADASFMGQVVSVLRDRLGDGADAALTPDQKAARRLEKDAEIFEKHLKINLEKESSVINVSFEHRDRAVAIEVLDTLLRLYMDKRRQLYMDARSPQAKQEADATHNRVIALQNQIEQFKNDNKIYSLPDQRTQLLAQRDAVHKQMTVLSSSTLQDRYDNINAQLDALNALERHYDDLQQELQVANGEYTIYAHKLDEAQAYDSNERDRAGSVRVIQPPSAPPEPKKLQGLIILAGFILSLFVVAVVAAFTEFSRSGFLTPERLQRATGLPVLCAVPLRRK